MRSELILYVEENGTMNSFRTSIGVKSELDNVSSLKDIENILIEEGIKYKRNTYSPFVDQRIGATEYFIENESGNFVYERNIYIINKKSTSIKISFTEKQVLKGVMGFVVSCNNNARGQSEDNCNLELFCGANEFRNYGLELRKHNFIRLEYSLLKAN